MRTVDVYNNNVLAGHLTEFNTSKYVFEYDMDYFNNSSCSSVAVSLPKRQRVYESERLFPFFFNLLPEGANKKAICTKEKIDENDCFGLLMSLRGFDFIGAISVR